MPVDLPQPPAVPRPERVIEYVLLTSLGQLALRDALFSAAESTAHAVAARERGLLDASGFPTLPGRALATPEHATTLLSTWGTPAAGPSPGPRRPITAADLPSARSLTLPRSARALFDRLREEPIGDWPALLRECSEHAQAFETGLAKNEFLPVEEARRLAAGIAVLQPRTATHRDPSFAERLAWIAARYFVIKLDGTRDFEVVGLDDDVAVFDAVCRTLEYDDLRIHRSA